MDTYPGLSGGQDAPQGTFPGAGFFESVGEGIAGYRKGSLVPVFFSGRTVHVTYAKVRIDHQKGCGLQGHPIGFGVFSEDKHKYLKINQK